MKAPNSKQLLGFIFNQMELLKDGKIPTEVAFAQSNLAKQANSAMRYEIQRSNAKIKLTEFNERRSEDSKIEDNL